MLVLGAETTARDLACATVFPVGASRPPERLPSRIFSEPVPVSADAHHATFAWASTGSLDSDLSMTRSGGNAIFTVVPLPTVLVIANRPP
jgi:hypothetical protein